MKPLRSGTTTGDHCQCGAAIWSYYEARDVPGVPLAGLNWYWYFVCERGHEQAEPGAQPMQLSLLEMLT